MDTKKFNFHKKQDSVESKYELKRKALDEVPMVLEEDEAPSEEEFIDEDIEVVDEDVEEETVPGIFAELLGDLDLTPEEYMEKNGLPELKDDDVEAAILDAFTEIVRDSECEELIELLEDEDLGLREKLEIASTEYEEVEDEEEIVDEEIVDEALEEAAEFEAEDSCEEDHEAEDSIDEPVSEEISTEPSEFFNALEEGSKIKYQKLLQKGWPEEKIEAYFAALRSDTDEVL